MYKMKHDGDVETESDSYNFIYDLVEFSFGFWSFVPCHVHVLALQCNDNKIKVYCLIPLHQISMVICLYSRSRMSSNIVRRIADERSALRFTIIYQSSDSRR